MKCEKMYVNLKDIVFIEKFDPETENAFNEDILARYAPLLPPTMIFGILIVIALQFWGHSIDPTSVAINGVIGLGLIVFLATCILLSLHPVTRANQRNWLFFCLYLYSCSAIGLSMTLANLPNGPIVGVGLLIFGTIPAPAFIQGGKRALVVMSMYLAVLAATLAWMGIALSDISNVVFWVGISAALSIFFTHLFDVINRRSFLLARLLESEKQRSEALLLNVLPQSISDRLKMQEEYIADRHNSVSVLFADIVNFTNLTVNLPATELVNMLNDIFSLFDGIVEKLGGEKIKTIGDAYMASAGLFGQGSDHACVIAEIALGMQQAVSDYQKQSGLKIEIRVGIHSGAVIAGVIGKRKLAYDLWGDTVNVANRMESQGLPGKIQLSGETRALLPKRFQTERRGEINIKGQSPRTTYLLNAKSNWN